MPREYGRIEHVRRTDKWRVIKYRGRKEIKGGEHDTRDDAVAELQAHVKQARKG